MIYRRRTVLGLMAATAIAVCGLTLVAVSLFEGHPVWQSSGTIEEASATSAAGADAGWHSDELTKLNKALNLIEDKYIGGADRQKVLDGALKGMVEALGDPFSAYIPSAEAAKFSDSVHGTFSGIGARLEISNGSIAVMEIMNESPAERAGLRPKDVLLSVNGQSLDGLTLNEAISKIRGPKGTKAKLSVKRADVEGLLNLELVRDRIDVDTVGGALDSDGIGKLWIDQFGMETAAQVKKELAALEAGGMKALIVDVRGNPGGILPSVLEVAELFVPKGKTIVQYESAAGQKKQELSQGELTQVKSYPVLVLMDEGTASSAEILAGALQQSAGAVLIGETTYGKGTVQISYNQELGDGSLMKLTVSKWLLPDGTWVNQEGLRPNMTVAQPDFYTAVRLQKGQLLKLDDNGEGVRNLQLMLESAGYPADRTDGYFSEATKKAVSSFQQQVGLPVTGQVDDPTADRLGAALTAALQKEDNDMQWQAARTLALRAIR